MVCAGFDVCYVQFAAPFFSNSFLPTAHEISTSPFGQLGKGSRGQGVWDGLGWLGWAGWGWPAWLGWPGGPGWLGCAGLAWAGLVEWLVWVYGRAGMGLLVVVAWLVWVNG